MVDYEISLLGLFTSPLEPLHNVFKIGIVLSYCGTLIFVFNNLVALF